MGELTAIDLFSGAGGLSLGLEMAGFRARLAVELDADACATYREALPGVEVRQESAVGFDFSPWRGEIALVAGGPPCQPFSTGGLMQGRRDARDMLPVFVRAVQEVRPRAFLMENVPGLASRAHEGYLREALAPLSGAYRITSKVLNAADFGVPQSRRRLFVVGSCEGEIELPGGGGGRPRPAGEVLGAEPLGEPNPSRIVYAKTPDLRPDPYHGQLFNGGGRPIDLARPAPTILASAGGNKTHFLDLEGLVPPYHAHLLRGGKPYVGELPGARRITVEESAALQTFPAGMRFSGRRSAQYAQVGNAVPPLLAAAVGAAIVGRLLRRPRRARPSLMIPGAIKQP